MLRQQSYKLGTCGFGNMTAKRWNGSQFVDLVDGYRRWDGTKFVICEFARRWDGSKWVDVWTGIQITPSGYFSSFSAGFGNYYDEGVFSLSILPSGGPSPTAYSWNMSDHGNMLSVMGGVNSSTFRLRGPNYDGGNFPQTFKVDIWCDVTINGKVTRSKVHRASYQGSYV